MKRFFFPMLILCVFSACSGPELADSGIVRIQSSPLLAGFEDILDRHPAASVEWVPNGMGSSGLDLAIWTGTASDIEKVRADYYTDLTGYRSRRRPETENVLLSYRLPAGAQSMIVPAGAYGWGLFYHRARLEELGGAVPEDFDEFVEFLRRSAAGGEAPVALGAEFGWPAMAWLCMIDLRLNGGTEHERLIRGERAFSEPGFVRAADLFIELARLGVFDTSAPNKNWPQALSDLENGDAVFSFMGGFAWDRIQSDDIGWFRFPDAVESDDDASWEMGQLFGFAVPVDAENPEAAFLLATVFAEAGSPGLSGTTFRLSTIPEGNIHRGAEANEAVLPPGCTILPSPDRWMSGSLTQIGMPLVRDVVEDPHAYSGAGLAAMLDELR